MPFPPKYINLAANWKQSRDGQLIQCIIAHDTERPSQDSNSIAYLQRGGERADGSDRKVSCHTLIEPNGDTYVMVPDEYGANHAGNGTLTINGRTYGPDRKYSLNDISLGFELEYTKAPFNGPYPEAQLLAMGYWINLKRERYGNLPIYRHQEVDPGRRSDTRNLAKPDIEQWARNAAILMGNIPTPEKPINYRAIVPQVVYTDRKLTSRFAGSAKAPLVLQPDQVVPIGDITNGWAWIAHGWGFVPEQTIVKA